MIYKAHENNLEHKILPEFNINNDAELREQVERIKQYLVHVIDYTNDTLYKSLRKIETNIASQMKVYHNNLFKIVGEMEKQNRGE